MTRSSAATSPPIVALTSRLTSSQKPPDDCRVSCQLLASMSSATQFQVRPSPAQPRSGWYGDRMTVPPHPTVVTAAVPSAADGG